MPARLAKSMDHEPKVPYLVMLDRQRSSICGTDYGFWDIYKPLVKCTALEDDVVQRTLQKIHETALLEESTYGLENLASNAYSEICNDVLDLAAGFLSTDVRQQRLLDLLKGFRLRDEAHKIEKFEIWRNDSHLAECVYDHLNQKHIYRTPGSGDPGMDDRETAQLHINLSAFISKLIGNGLVPISAVMDCPMHELLNGLEPSTAEGNEGIVLELWRTACTVSATEYIFHAGPQILEALKESNKTTVDWLKGRHKWKVWGDQFAELARTANDDAPWCLRTNAAKAHRLMVDLASEDFKDSESCHAPQQPSKDMTSSDSQNEKIQSKTTVMDNVTSIDPSDDHNQVETEH